MIPAATLPVEAPEDVLFDTPLARLAIGSAGAVDRLITRTQGQMALGVRLGRLVCAHAGLPMDPPGLDLGDRPRLHPVRQMPRPSNVSPLRVEDRLSAMSANDGPAPSGTVAQTVSVQPTPSEPLPVVGDLAIPGFDELAASQVVKRLDALTAAELAAIGAYEQANRGRRTILTRVRQLQSSM